MKPPIANTVSHTDVLTAQARISGVIVRTPCEFSPALSDLTASRIWCKQEYRQRTGSFKERGACNALHSLSPQIAQRGVVAASAGNHALGLAWHGRTLGIPVTVVVPRSAPQVKVAKCQALGARVVLHGETFDETVAFALALAKAENLTCIPPFDDATVIAGQGTLALEFLEQVPDVEAVVVPVGGGGLLAGVVTVLRTLRPDVQIIGVEPENAANFSAAVRAKKPVRVSTQATLADGLAVAEIGRLTYSVAADWVDRVVTVSEEELGEAIAALAVVERAVVEGAGAAGLAALLSGKLPELTGKRVVLPLTGGNINPVVHQQIVQNFWPNEGQAAA